MMEVAQVFDELNHLKTEVQAGLHRIGGIEFDKDSMEEQFLSSFFSWVMSDMDYLVESIDYINKPVMREGPVTGCSQRLFIGDFELREGDTVECLIDGAWEQIDIFKIRGAFRDEQLFGRMRNQEVRGRIRLTEEEFKNRALQQCI